jgi:hypothetical protein
MAQKFTVDPRMLAGHSDYDQEKNTMLVSSITVKETRTELLERLAKEYEEEQNKAADGGCLACSS